MGAGVPAVSPCGIARFGVFWLLSKVAASFFAYFSRFIVFPELILQISRVEKKYTFVNTYLSSGHRTGKGQFSFQSQRRAMSRNVQIALISHSSKVMLKIV